MGDPYILYSFDLTLSMGAVGAVLILPREDFLAIFCLLTQH